MRSHSAALTSGDSHGRDRPVNLSAEADKLPGDYLALTLPCDADWKLVRRVEPRSAHGVTSKLYVKRLPAAFYRLVTGDIEIITGTGYEVERLIERVAAALADGKLRFATRSDGIVIDDLVLEGDPALITEFEGLMARDMIGFRS